MDEDTRAQSGVIGRTVENLSAVLICILPGSRGRELHAGPADGIVAFGIYVIVAVIGTLAFSSPEGFSADVTRGAAGFAALSVACAVAALTLVRSGGPGGLAVGLLWALALGVGLSTVTSLIFEVTSRTDWVTFAVLPGYLPPLLFLLNRFGPIKGLVVAVAAALPGMAGVYDWYVHRVAADGVTAGYETPDTEMIYSVQRDLLAAETNVRPGVPGRPELFAILGAGYAHEGVFGREVRAAADLLEADFDAGGRIVRMINDDNDPTGYPLLNRGNLQTALERVARAMNGEDILFMYLTSHGGPGALSTQFYPVITRDIGPADIDRALTEAGIGNAVVVISACYSGSFTEALKRPDRLILTAARADRTSFGCSDKAEWTEWGRAFFVDALPDARDPRAAALRARDLVAERETALGLEPSEPQIVEGDAIGAALDAWLATLPPG